MAFCTNCGSQIQGYDKFCPSCGAAVNAGSEQQTNQGSGSASRAAGPYNTADTTDEYDARDISENKFMGILAYLGLLWLIPFFARKNSKFARYHCKQGLNLLLLNAAYTVFSILLSSIFATPVYLSRIYYGSYTPLWVSTILWLLALPIVALMVLGIVNVARGKARELPVIGKIKIMK